MADACPRRPRPLAPLTSRQQSRAGRARPHPPGNGPACDPSRASSRSGVVLIFPHRVFSRLWPAW